jgi:transcriptional regulator with XRE-family HTH domain
MAKRAQTLDELLLERGLGRWQVAQKAGLSPTSVRDWCEGVRAPRNQQLAKLAKAIGVPAARVAEAVAASQK